MEEWVYVQLGHIAAWFPWVLGAVMVASAAALIALRRGRVARRWVRILVGAAAWCAFGGAGVALLAGYLLMGPVFRSAGSLEATIGHEVPDIEFRHVADDRPDRLSALRGHVVLVNLWGTWCGPCRDEMPTLNAIHRAYAPKGAVVLTLSDEPRALAAVFLAEYAPDTMNGYVTSYGWLTLRQFRPFTLVIDRRGVLRDFFFGSQDYAVFEAKVREALN